MARAGDSNALQQIELPAGRTLAALVVGLALGWALAGGNASESVLAVSGPVGRVWLSALQMTIIPLVAALLVTGIARMVATARAGTMARRTLMAIVAVLAAGSVLAGVLTPLLLEVFPIPGVSAAALAVTGGPPQEVPGIGAFLESLVAPNVFAAAAETAMLPLIVFFVALAVAITRLEEGQRETLLRLFAGLGNAMLIVIGWVLWLAPAGVFALAIGVGLRSGGGAFAALGHYILLVSTTGLLILLAAYGLALLAARQSLPAFARAVMPAQAVALSTQSSLASLPAMLGSCRQLGVREATADFVLPLAVAIFRATSPAMNLAVAIYVARLTGVVLTPTVIATGVAVALVTTVGSVSLPGAVSFVTSIGPIALAMGVPVEPLALLVAVEMLPDIVRTVGNVTMDVAVTAWIDRGHPAPGEPATDHSPNG
ncbi:sodium:dicarboxylate symporter [Altererythrobacter sp. B11]|uniref:dicarboxylate/amino acid:cation symporter n=1 Tax=Altererythrobacter sp. B11 TaxID=2060312 RepID=UPI000DC6D993|nr:cation:dicarboxylase symporter family transporter [Altererythrobacter sp. B11]BBC74394.1 sodium:dicarboxylate symporter [Altererythrobacter sp. B11]